MSTVCQKRVKIREQVPPALFAQGRHFQIRRPLPPTETPANEDRSRNSQVSDKLPPLVELRLFSAATCVHMFTLNDSPQLESLSYPTPGNVDATKFIIEQANTLLLGDNSRRL
jgi:hypothetical protein